MNLISGRGKADFTSPAQDMKIFAGKFFLEV